MDIGEQAAFPRPASEYTAGGTLPDGNDAVQGQRGMTYRQWLAGMALQARWSNSRIIKNLEAGAVDDQETAVTMAKYAVVIADALIAELSKAHASLDH